ncbi:MAG: hypothetical protein ACD_43C00228G0001 [uncultured bacterium]|nr:MAG: hypothetical protein ACD_43C00228G0001 [uncultured bacterium]
MTIAQHQTKNNTVAVAMSGGVDSAVSAALLLQQGYQVEAFYMKNWSDEAEAMYRGKHDRCPWEDDMKDVKAICAHLKIPFQSINFEKEYRTKVFQYFLEEIKAGCTPNPDVLCNTQIKFLAFLNKALALGFEKIATGHYARVGELRPSAPNAASWQLLKGVDPNKDQSYFIYHLNQTQLAKILFPIGHLQKSEVRKLAQDFKLPVAHKPDSQGLCFIGDINFQTFLKQYVKAEPGPMILTDGTIMGQHKGLAYYTIGQRQGLEIGGTGPYYVVEKRLADNTLIICQGANDKSLLSSWCTFAEEHWVSGVRPAEEFECSAKIRYRSPDVKCRVIGNHIEFAEPARAVTPGQFAVFYNGDQVLGGGVITARELLV